MVALPEPRPETPRQRQRRESIENVQRELLGRQLMFDELSPAGQAARRAEILPTLKGIGVGIPATILGLPADIIGLPAIIGDLLANLTGQDPNAVYKELAEMSPEERDANLLSLAQSPQEYAALSEFFNTLEVPVPVPAPRPTEEEREDDDVPPLPMLPGMSNQIFSPPMRRITRDIQKAAGAEGIARLAGFGDDFEDPNFRQGFTTAEVLTPIPLLDFGIPALMKRGSRSTDLVSDTPQVGFTGEVELPNEEDTDLLRELIRRGSEQQPTRLQSTGDITPPPEFDQAVRIVQHLSNYPDSAGMRDVILRNPNLARSTISGVLSNLEGRYIAGADVSDETVSLVQQILRGEAVNVPGVTTRMATQEETDAFIAGEDPAEVAPTDEGIATLPAAEDVIDVEPLVTAAARTDTDVGNPVEASRQAYPITEEITTLPDAPVEPLPVQGEIIDYTPVYRALTLLPEEQVYTFEGIAQLLKSLPSSARRDLYNLGAIDDPMVVPLDEANYDKYLKSKNQDKSFSEFTTERNASQRKAPDFIKLKENNNGELVFAKEIKKSDDPDNPAKNVQKQPQSSLLSVLEDYARMERQRLAADPTATPVTLTKAGVLNLYNTVSPQVAVKSVQTSDVVRPQGMDDPEYFQMLEQQDVTPQTAAKVESLGTQQNPFSNNAGTDATMMIFNNPARTSFLDKEFKGVPGHDYFGGSDMIPGYIGHVRYDNITPVEEVQPGVFQPTGEKFAGYLEGQSNLQSALRGTGEDAQSLARSDIEPVTPDMLLFMKSVEEELEGTGLSVANDKLDAVEEASKNLRNTTDPSETLRKRATNLSSRALSLRAQLVNQVAGDFGSNGSRLDVLATQARELSDVMDRAGYLGDYEGFLDFIQNSGSARADDFGEEVADIFETIKNDYTTRNGMTENEYQYFSGIDPDTDATDLAADLAEGSKLHELLFGLAKAGGQPGNTPLRESFGIPDNIIQRGAQVRRQNPPDEVQLPLSYRIQQSEKFTDDEQSVLQTLAERPEVDEDTLIDLINGEGAFEGRGLTDIESFPLTYKKIMAEFREAQRRATGTGDENAGTAVVMALKAMTENRTANRAEQLSTINDVLVTPEAISDLQALGRPAEEIDILRTFLRNATPDQIHEVGLKLVTGGPLHNRLKAAGAGTYLRREPNIREIFESQYLQLPEQQAKERIIEEAPIFAKAAEPDNLALMNANIDYGLARQAQKAADDDFIREVIGLTGQDTIEEFGRTAPIETTRQAQTSLSKFTSDLVREKINEGTVISPSDYGEDELVDMVKNTIERRYPHSAPKFAVPTAFGNPAQLNHFMYRSFIQEAIKKGYDGVVFPSWQAQKSAHIMDSEEVAKLTYQKSLIEALDIIRKEHPEFPSYEELTQPNFKYQTTTGGERTVSDDSVVLRFTPEIRAIFEGRVIRRAKGGEVDLRPQKMIHSGIGAMAREVM